MSETPIGLACLISYLMVYFIIPFTRLVFLPIDVTLSDYSVNPNMWA